MENVSSSHNRAVIYCLIASLLILVCSIFSVLKIHYATKQFVGRMSALSKQTTPPIPENLEFVTVRFRSANGSGSGVAISPTQILSNHHVIQEARENGGTIWADVTRPDGTIDSFVATVEKTDGARDLAILKVPTGHEFKIWANLSKRPPKWGEPVLSAGCAASHLPIPTQGYFTRRMSDGRWQLSLVSFFGSSGGPVFDVNGDLIAVIVACERPQYVKALNREIVPSYIFYGVPANWISDFLSNPSKAEPVEPTK